MTRIQLIDMALADIAAAGVIRPATWALLSDRDRKLFAPYYRGNHA